MNRRMLAVGAMLLGSGIQTLRELQAVLKNLPEAVTKDASMPGVYHFPDGSALRFSEHEITDRDGQHYTEVIAADVSELMAVRTRLDEENARLDAANEALRKLGEEMADIVREEEILNMKIRVHDDIGYSLLSVRRAYWRCENMDGLFIEQNIDCALAVFAGDLDICPTGCHGNGSPLLPDSQAASIVPGEDVSAGAANELVISAISHVNPPRYCSFLSAAYFLEMNFPSIRKSRSDSHKFHPDRAMHRSMDMNDKNLLYSPLRFPDDSRSTPKIEIYTPNTTMAIFCNDCGQSLCLPRSLLF